MAILAPPRPGVAPTAAPVVSPAGGWSWRIPLQLAVLGGAVALLVFQLRDVDLGALLSHLDLAWSIMAVVGLVLSMAVAAHNISAFAPVRLRPADTLQAQLAISGLRVIAPSVVSTPAIGTRFLVRHGLPMATAVTVLAVAQTAQLLMTIVVVGLIALVASAGLPVTSGTTLMIAVVVIAVAVVIALCARRVAAVRTALQPVRVIAAHLRDNPRRVASGLAASGLLTLAHVGAFVACVHAVGGDGSVLVLTAVYLGASSAGSLVPTPAGIGAVEAALVSGLAASGMSMQVAASAALLSRLLTVWVPAVPGWWALRSLRRRGLL